MNYLLFEHFEGSVLFQQMCLRRSCCLIFGVKRPEPGDGAMCSCSPMPDAATTPPSHGGKSAAPSSEVSRDCHIWQDVPHTTPHTRLEFISPSSVESQ